MVSFREARRQSRIQNNHSIKRNRNGKKTKRLLEQICYNLGTRGIQDSTKSVQNFKINEQGYKRNGENTWKRRRKRIYSLLGIIMEHKNRE